MDQFWHFLETLMHPKSIIEFGGIYLLLFIIFAETGLFFGFFLPGDSLLFIAGLVAATSKEAKLLGNMDDVYIDMNIAMIVTLVSLAGILGNFVGYWFGKKTGPVLFKKNDSFLFKKKYMEGARDFYHKYGGLALILGRFMPIIRTFVPIFAGIVKVEYQRFVLYNILGSVLWVSSMCLSGYFLGITFPNVQNYLEYIVIGIIFLSMVPILIAFLRKMLSK